MKRTTEAVVNDSPVDCQSREVTEVKFSAENLTRPCGSNPFPATKNPHSYEWGYTCYFSAMSPLMMGVFIRRNNMEEIAPHIGNAARQTKLIKEFIFAGLDNFKVK